MTLIVQELQASALTQVVTPDQNTIVEAIRPHIYRHHFATGTLQIQIKDNTNTVIATSEKINIADIGTMQFFHGYVRFYINAYLTAGQAYTICLTAQDGYSFAESAYCGWCNGFDLGKYPATSIPASAVQSPLDLEIWERKAV